MSNKSERSLQKNLVDRRTLLGAVTAAGLFGFGGSAEAQEAPMATGLAKSAVTGKIRRVATATDAEGKSFIASDEVIPIGNLWSTTGDQILGAGPANESAPQFRSKGASVCSIVTIEKADPMPTLENRIGFHQTPGVAYVFLLNGELTFMVDREEVLIRGGDVVIERGTMHSWRNESDTPVGMLFAMVSGEELR